MTRRALVVDDSRTVRRILAGYLSELGFKVAHASDGVDALEHLTVLGPLEVALVDWNMPRMTGLALVRLVRANPGFSAMRIVMVTTEGSTDAMSQAFSAGADEYVIKPFSREVIADKLALLESGI